MPNVWYDITNKIHVILWDVSAIVIISSFDWTCLLLGLLHHKWFQLLKFIETLKSINVAEFTSFHYIIISSCVVVSFSLCGPLLILSVIVICRVLQRCNIDNNIIEFKEDPTFKNKVNHFHSFDFSSTISASIGSVYNSRKSSFSDST